MNQLTEEQNIEYKRRVEAFLADDAVVYALSGLKRDYFEAFSKPGLPPTGLSELHAKVRALSDIGDALQSVINAGTMAQAQKANREQREAREAETRQRQGRR